MNTFTRRPSRWLSIAAVVATGAVAALLLHHEATPQASAHATPSEGNAVSTRAQAHFRVLRPAATAANIAPRPITSVISQLEAKQGNLPLLREVTTATDGTTIWAAAGAAKICLLAEEPSGVVQTGCQTTIAAEAGNLWLQRDGSPGRGQVFGLVPDGSGVRQIPVSGVGAANLPLANNGYVASLGAPSSIRVTTGTGVTKVIAINELP